MASRYHEGTPESQYGPGPKVLPNGHVQGISRKDQFYNENLPPFGSNYRMPSSGNVQGVNYSKGLSDLSTEVDNYEIAFARGDDKYLEVAFRRVDLKMDQIFRGPETAKKPDVLRSNLGGRPISPSEAIDFIFYFSFRVTLEFGQATQHEFDLPTDDYETLTRLTHHARNVHQQCAGYKLFSNEQGWRYNATYDELWRGEWRHTTNARHTWMDTVLNSVGTNDEPVSQTVASSASPTPKRKLTESTTPEAPMVTTSSAIPAAPTRVFSLVVRTAGTPLTPTAATTVDTPMAPKRRTSLPISRAQQRDRKRSRSSSPPTSPSPKRKATRLPVSGKFPRMARVCSNRDSSSTRQQVAAGDVSVATASNTMDKQTKAKSKTINEQAKGDRLLDDHVGQDATSPCTACQKRPGRACRVARDPVEFNSLKCNHCIRSKLGGCFSTDNPGFPYENSVIDRMRAFEKSRAKGSP